MCVHVQGRQKNERQAAAPGCFVRDRLAFGEKAVKASGKRVKTRQVSISSMKTRREKAKAEVAEGVSAHPRQRKRWGRSFAAA